MNIYEAPIIQILYIDNDVILTSEGDDTTVQELDAEFWEINP